MVPHTPIDDIALDEILGYSSIDSPKGQIKRKYLQECRIRVPVVLQYYLFTQKIIMQPKIQIYHSAGSHTYMVQGKHRSIHPAHAEEKGGQD